MTESQQRTTAILVVTVAIVFSMTLTVWVIYAVRTHQDIVPALAHLPWFSLVMGLVLVPMAVFLGTKAVREQSWSRDTRWFYFLFAVSSLLFGLASLLRAFGAADSLWFPFVQLAIGVWGIRLMVHVFFLMVYALSGLRSWRTKRNHVG